MKQLIIKPDGWECLLDECPAGFFIHEEQLCFKTEYRNESFGVDAYNSAGERFIQTGALVQPVIFEWREDQ